LLNGERKINAMGFEKSFHLMAAAKPKDLAGLRYRDLIGSDSFENECFEGRAGKVDGILTQVEGYFFR
jgi:hypothetical protein